MTAILDILIEQHYENYNKQGNKLSYFAVRFFQNMKMGDTKVEIPTYAGIWLFEERIYKLEFVEYLQIINPLTHTDIFYRNLELVGNPDDDASFGSTIEFGDG